MKLPRRKVVGRSSYAFDDRVLLSCWHTASPRKYKGKQSKTAKCQICAKEKLKEYERE